MPTSFLLASIAWLADVLKNATKISNKNTKLSFGTWNVRTLIDQYNSDNRLTRPARRTALVGSELSRYGIDIAALSETRLSESDHLTEIASGYTFFWKGKEKDERREAGVGFAIKSTLVNKLEEHPIGLSERLMTLRVNLGKARFVTILSAYAPTLTSSEETITSFYTLLRKTLRSIPAADKILLMGDFNARVGTDHNMWNCLGHHGVGKMNDNGLLLLQLCEELELCITNTIFKHKGDHTTTWMHPRSKKWHLIDYVITRKRDMQDITNVKSFHNSECWTDHALVRASVKFKIRPKTRSNNKELPKRLDISRINDPAVKEKLVESFNALPEISSWESFRDNMFDRAATTLGFSKAKNQDWFDDNNQEIQHLLTLKRNVHALTLQNHLSARVKISVDLNYKQVKSQVQKSLRHMEDAWWDKLANETQAAADANDSKSLYHLLSKAFGPRKSSVAPLRSKDGTLLYSKTDDIGNRWKEHFTDLLNIPSTVDENVILSLEQKPIVEHLKSLPTISEVNRSIKKLNKGKAPGSDGLFSELFTFGGDHLQNILHAFLCKIWEEESVPADWKNAIMIPIFKNKGLCEDCGNYRGISLLASAGKILAGILLSRLNKHIASNVLPETQCGFRAKRGTVDMIFTARQIQEKCREQCMDLYQVFIDLKKAFDTVNRKALWIVLAKLGCPDKFVSLVKALHDGMKAWVNVDGELTEAISVENGVKQGDILGPLLFSLYFAVVFSEAFSDCDRGIYIRYRTSGKLFRVTRMKAKTLTQLQLIRDLLYADDCDLVAHTVEDLQFFMDCLSGSCKNFGLTISIPKTEVMYQPAPGNPYLEPVILVDGHKLKVVDKFPYLGSVMNRFCTLDDEVISRIQKATDAFKSLESRCWKKHSIKQTTKIKVYATCVLSALLYACESWAPYKHHIRKLERFHQQSLRRILNTTWSDYIPDTDILERTGLTSIECMTNQHRLRWVGNLVRMPDCRIPKQVFYGELSIGKRPFRKPKLRFKDSVKSSLQTCNIGFNTWETQAKIESEWRKAILSGAKAGEDKRVQHEHIKRAVRKREHIEISDNLLTCEKCSRVCLSKAGYKSHMRSHEVRQKVVYDLSDEPPTCNICSKICKSLGGLKRHKKLVHGETSTIITSRQARNHERACKSCGKICRSLAGLMSHLRSHAYKQ